ncbi:MAG: hydroxymyristoyl-ACP dehydratase [Cytophagaceae bacterium]
MLKDNFYKVVNSEIAEGQVKTHVEINPAHNIFNGHFPGTPVVPGVCMVQMIKESLESAVNKKLMLTKGDNLKFMNIVDPRVNKYVTLDIMYKLTDEQNIKTTAVVVFEDKVFFKFSGSFCSNQ